MIDVKITKEPLVLEDAINLIRSEENGAEISFSGVVRNNNLGRKVLFLEYEAYPDMAEKVLQKIGEDACKDYDISNIVLWHRTGHLEISEVSMVIAVGAPHRAAAFEACRDAVEKVKALAPVWKREVWEGGKEWIGQQG
ncbi:MAG: molybdenum cofactor biosynthesis protein MoaE [Chloroflexota bacterium]|nr:molybdenum cofactor biosynthesis protein MoaE [Chloroflexota bacterium]